VRYVAHFVWLVVVFAAAVSAQELPDSPTLSREATANPVLPNPVVWPGQGAAPIQRPARILDMKFVSLAIVSTAGTFADSYTTIWAGQNWRAGKQNVCNVEAESPYLYGRHPTPGRAYVVAAGKSAGTLAASYFLRKRWHTKLWSLPLLATAVLSLDGVGRNLMVCN
jgi:hypothetical protein